MRDKYSYSWLQPIPRNFSVSKRRAWLWYRLRGIYHEAPEYELLKRIEAWRKLPASDSNDDLPVNSLLLFRHEIRNTVAGYRSVCRRYTIGAVPYYLAFCPAEMIPIGVWLLGQCADRFHTFGVAEFRDHPSPQVRQQVAKALRRLEARAMLEEMAAAYPDDEKIQRFANAPVVHRPFADRLRCFKSNIDGSRADEVSTPSRMPYWAQESDWSYTPPKSVVLIRRMLRRIRHWVRWGVKGSET